MLKEQLRELVDKTRLKLTEQQKTRLAADLFSMAKIWIDAPEADRELRMKAARERSLVRLGLKEEQVPVLITFSPKQLDEHQAREESERYGKRLLKELARLSGASQEDKVALAEFRIESIERSGGAFQTRAMVSGLRIGTGSVQAAISRSRTRPKHKIAEVKIVAADTAMAA